MHCPHKPVARVLIIPDRFSLCPLPSGVFFIFVSWGICLVYISLYVTSTLGQRPKEKIALLSSIKSGLIYTDHCVKDTSQQPREELFANFVYVCPCRQTPPGAPRGPFVRSSCFSLSSFTPRGDSKGYSFSSPSRSSVLLSNTRVASYGL